MRRSLALAVATLAFVGGVPHHHARYNPDAPNATVTIYEDGSGVQYLGDKEVRTFPHDTFVWDCHTMGNRRCGSVYK